MCLLHAMTLAYAGWMLFVAAKSAVRVDLLLLDLCYPESKEEPDRLADTTT